MSESLGVLTVDMLARIGGFVDPMKAAEKQADTTSKKIVHSMDGIDIQSARTSKAISVMAMSVKAALAGISIAQITKMADGYTQTAARIENATNSATEYDLVQKRLYETANSTYRALSEAQEVYLGLAGGMKALGYATEDTLDVSDSLSFAFVANAARADQAQSAIDSFSKSMAKGKVDADAWISIVTAADNVIADMSRTTGMSETQIRKLGAEGKISLEDLIKTLKLTRDENKALADSMSNSLGDGFTKLTNGLTQYFGELNRGLGVTNSAAGVLGDLGDNIETVANIAMVAAAGYAGTYIPAVAGSVTAGYAKITQLVQQIAVENIAIQTERQMATQQVASAQATLVQLQAEKTLEAQRLKAQITAQGRMASITRIAELKKIEAQVTRELAVAETALATAQSRTAMSSGALLGVLGGPVGMGLTVAAVAAGYLLMRDNGEKANDMLSSQGRYANMAAEGLDKLSGAQKQAAVKELSEQLMIQSGQLQGAKNDFEELTLSIYKANKSNLEAYRIWGELKSGVIDVNTAFHRLNSSNFITSEQINQLAEAKSKVDAGDDAVKKTNQSLDRARISGANAAAGYKMAGDSAATAAVSVEELAKANAKVNSRRTDAQYLLQTSKLLNGNVVLAKQWLEYRNDIGLGSTGRPLTNEEKQRLSEAFKQQQQLKAYEDSLTEAKRKSLSASKNAISQAKKDENDLKRLYEDQFNLRESIYYKYADRVMKIEKDLQNEISEIQKASFSNKDTAGYIQNAKNRADLEKQLYEAQLDAEFNDWNSTEKQKLDRKVLINELMIQLDADMNDERKKQAIQSLIGQANQEFAWMKLEQSQRISDAGEMLRTDLQNMEIRYSLERNKILENAQIAREEQERLIALSQASQDFENRQNLNDATRNWGGSYADMMGTSQQYQLDQTKFSRFDESQALFDAQMVLAESAAEREAIWQAHNDRMAMIDEEYWRGTAQLNLSYGEQITGSFADMAKTMYGEQSGAYKAMFAASKAFAIAQSLVSISQGIAMASANPFPYNLAAMATVAASTAGLVSNIQSVAGVFHGGTDYVPKESSYLLDKGERVLSPRQNSDLTRYLNDRQSSNGDGVNVNINVPAGYTANESRDGNGNVTIDVVEKFVKQAFSNLNQANSFESKQIRNNFNVGRVR